MVTFIFYYKFLFSCMLIIVGLFSCLFSSFSMYPLLISPQIPCQSINILMTLLLFPPPFMVILICGVPFICHQQTNGEQLMTGSVRGHSPISEVLSVGVCCVTLISDFKIKATSNKYCKYIYFINTSEMLWRDTCVFCPD